MRVLFFYIPILLASTLLFLIQPLIGKHLLPLFGGTSYVWTTAMLFFQTALLLGYYYTYSIAKLRPRTQAIIHTMLLFAGLCFIVYLYKQNNTAILAPLDYLLPSQYPPILQAMLLLITSVGLPYFILSTTSTLLSKWHYMLFPTKSPYPLYAISNIGSLLAIAAYPFILEPLASTKTIAQFWTLFFLLTCILLIACSVLILRVAKKDNIMLTKSSVKLKRKSNSPPDRKTYIGWLLLAAASSFTLLSATNILTQSVAPLPFLWLLPLGIYLVTFSASFQQLIPLNSSLFALCALILAPFCFLFTITIVPNFILTVALFSMFLFCSFMVYHTGLYLKRPHPEHLEKFYLTIALGSALGSALVAIAAPLLLPGLWEFQISLLITLAASLFSLNKYRFPSVAQLSTMASFDFHHGIKTKLKAMIVLVVLLGSAALFLFFILLSFQNKNTKHTLTALRSFYGLVSVKESTSKSGKIRLLLHGRINHGLQYTEPTKAQIPTSYYGLKSGVGIALEKYREINKQDSEKIRMGVIGLGVGTLAIYGQAGDDIRFFEINPDIEYLARKYFTYLKGTPAETDVVIGDGRLLLEAEEQKRAKPYDVLVLDAFSDDAIPIHVITKEAFMVYKLRLKKNGIIVANISNSYLDLTPVIKQLAIHNEMEYAIISEDGDPTQNLAPSLWAILTTNKSFLNDTAFQDKKIPDSEIKDLKLWTDSYSNLFNALR